MRTFIVHYIDSRIHKDTFEVQADNAQDALDMAHATMNATTPLDQNFILAIDGVEEKQEV